jgi:putative membrane protein
MFIHRIFRERQTAIIIMAFSAFLLTPFIQSDAGAQGGRYDGWHPMMHGWGGGGFGMIINVAIWIIAIAALVWLIRWLFQLGGRSGADSGSSPRALDILNERYASGEIDKSQYDAMKRDIESR